MSADYRFFANPVETPQNQPIPGKESQMTKMASGGYAFKADLWTHLRRCLILGTASGSYYAGKNELTREFATTVKEAIAQDPEYAANEIVYASEGKAINNHAPIFALALLSASDKPEGKAAFLSIFPRVIRTASHFYEWLSYTKATRGMGRIVQKAGKGWLQRQNVKWLAYQLLKYQSRYGFSARDALRLFKPNPGERSDLNFLYGWAVGKHEDLFEMMVYSGDQKVEDQFKSLSTLEQLYWYEWLKKNPDRGSLAVRRGKLTHEMVTGVCNINQDVWQALFETMPIGATLRNLGSLTEIGVLKLNALDNIQRVRDRLLNPDLLRKAFIHPTDVLKALKTYKANGKLGKSGKFWQYVPAIADILEDCLSLSFDTLEPSGKVFLHAVDVSGSMSWNTIESVNLTCAEIAGIMALTTAKAEQNYIIRGFSTEFKDLGITARDSYTSAIKKVQDNNFGGTDASVAYNWAIANKVKADVICFWTDGESWAGREHPTQALARYRRLVNSEVIAIYVTLAPNKYQLSDPMGDINSFELFGFNPTIPRVIQSVAAGII